MRHFALPLFALAALAARPAFPCSPIEPSLDGTAVPKTASVDVPLNTLITIHVFEAPHTFTLLLTDEEGTESIPPSTLDGELLIVSPATLEANHQYTLSFELDESLSEFSGREPITFTTGDAMDDVAPTIANVDEEPEVNFDGRDGIGGGLNSCGPQQDDFYFVTVKVPEATDDKGLAGVRLLRIDENGGRVEKAVSLAGDSDRLTAVETEGGTATYVVEAFDLAGNISETGEFTVDLVRPLLGCSATHARTPSSPFSFALLFFVGVLTVRRRR